MLSALTSAYIILCALANSFTVRAWTFYMNYLHRQTPDGRRTGEEEVKEQK